MTAATGSDLSWLLDDLVSRLGGGERAVLLSADGLLMGRSRGLEVADAEHLAAVSSGFQSLAKGASRQFRGGVVRQTVIEMDDAFMVVTGAGQGACLALIAAADTDMGMVAYEMNLMVKRVGTYLTSAPRAGDAVAADRTP